MAIMLEMPPIELTYKDLYGHQINKFEDDFKNQFEMSREKSVIKNLTKPSFNVKKSPYYAKLKSRK